MSSLVRVLMKGSVEQISVNRSMPLGVIIPELAYADVRAAAEWLCRTFGLVERLRIGEGGVLIDE